MVRTIAMLVLCIIVAGSMVATLILFLRKLAKIEEQMWGEKAQNVISAKKKAHAA